MKREELVSFNKTNILSAAKKLFKQNGIDKTTMDDMALEAGISKSTIYVYFKSKDEIYNEIVYEYFLILRDSFEKISKKNMTFEEMCYAICFELVGFREKYPIYFEVLLSTISIKEKDFKKYPILKKIYDTGENINLIISTILEKGKKENVIREDINIIETTLILYSAICGFIVTTFNKKEYFEKVLNIDIHTFLDNGFKMILKSLLK